VRVVIDNGDPTHGALDLEPTSGAGEALKRLCERGGVRPEAKPADSERGDGVGEIVPAGSRNTKVHALIAGHDAGRSPGTVRITSLMRTSAS
jgi:hypothetical protein